MDNSIFRFAKVANAIMTNFGFTTYQDLETWANANTNDFRAYVEQFRISFKSDYLEHNDIIDDVINSILSKAEIIDEIVEPQEEVTEEPTTYTQEALEALKKSELVDILNTLDSNNTLTSSNTKEELIEAILQLQLQN